MANTINWGKSYSYSYWGNGQNDNSWGDDYYIAYLTSDLQRRADNFENNNETVKLLEEL